MTVDDRARKIEDIFNSALKHQGARRSAYVRWACAGDEEMRQEVESLLRYNSELPGFLETPALGQAAANAVSDGGVFLGRSFGPYLVMKLLGAGGMGEVYLARDTRLGRLVALKILPNDLATDAERKRRFLLEAKAISRLQHPNIVTLYDIGSEADTDFLVMEYVQGQTLDKLIPPEGLEAGMALEYAIQISKAFEVAHAAGIIHRDLKPGNVIVADEGTVKVLDFGLAKLIATEEPAGENTTPATTFASSFGTILGTPHYMSPEQAQAKPMDARSDVFSFGVVLYELLTGLHPFEGETRQSVLAAIVSQETQPLTDRNGMPGELERIISQCLQKDPERRYQRMADVRVALEKLKGSHAGTLPATQQDQRRFPVWSIPALALSILVLSVVTLFLRPSKMRNSPERNLTRLTWTSSASQPAISRDGKLLAYSAIIGDGSKPDIWVQRIGGEAQQVTHDPTGASIPAFAPDGKRVAYVSRRRGIFEVPTTGGEPRFIVRGCCAGYLPDGSRILFFDEQDRLSSVPLSGGPSARIAPTLRITGFGALSPDGTKMLARGEASGTQGSRWWFFSLTDETLKEVMLPQGPRQDDVPDPEAWVMIHGDPNRQWLIFGRWSASSSEPYNSGENRNLFRVAVSADGALSRVPEQLTFAPGTAIYASVADTGRMVFRFDNQSASFRSIPLDTDGARITGQTKEFKRLEGRFNPAPSLSRDGRRVAYWSGRRIATADRQTGQEIVLTPELHPLHSAGPKMSPDGSQVIYYQRDDDNAGKLDLYTIASGGGVPRQICRDCGLPGGLSADGKHILTIVESAHRIALVDVSSGAAKGVLRHPGYSLESPALSWDDQWIAFVGRVDGLYSRIFIARIRNLTAAAEEIHWIPITGGTFLDQKPQFSPGGSILYFASDRDGSKCLWAQRLEPRTKRPLGKPFAIQHFHQSLSTFRSTPEVNVSRSEIVTHMDLIPGDVWMMELEHNQ